MEMLLISGHGDGDSGAVSEGHQEQAYTREIVNGIVPLLSKYANVHVYPQSRNAYKDLKSGNLQVNFKDYDYVCEIHLNAGGGKGSEVYVTKLEKAVTVETNIVNNLASLGFANRGVKVENWAVIYNAKSKGVSSCLVETFFIDSASDRALYASNKEAVYNAITNGIVKGFGLTNETVTVVPSPEPEKPTTGTNNEYTGTSIVDYLKSIGVDSSYENREKLAKQYGISGYAGTSSQNTLLLNAMRGNTSSNTNNATTSNKSYYKAFDNKSIVDGLKSINVASDLETRTKIAKANGINNYTGSTEQNIKLLSLARQGILISI